MKRRTIKLSQLADFELHLTEDEKSRATVKKYLHDVGVFVTFAAGRGVDKMLVLEYKAQLASCYKTTSANSMLAALNSFFQFCGWPELCVRQFKVQKKAYCAEEKELSREEYRRLVQTALRQGNERLALVLQTICATGIRVSELSAVTVEALARGEVTVRCKGKTRTIFLVTELRKKLKRYAKTHQIRQGSVFVTRTGKVLDRSNIWREMKALCAQAGVLAEKVFPHNLRHLFARVFYSMEKDIAKLADILGHSNINTTRIYIISTGAEHKRRMETMHLIL